jgi:gamma-glutamylcyclotransferase (GGCT)/AIG2-like uncharacterized protein YtfP
MRGESAHPFLVGRAMLMGEGFVNGTLLDLGGFPGLVEGAGRVRGEIWRVTAPELLRTLDEYEGYNFERRRTTATLAHDRRVETDVYWYRGPRSAQQTIIPEGHWRRHRWR